MNKDHAFTDEIVYHPDYPSAEHIAGARQTFYSKRIVLLFQASYGVWFSRPIFSLELLQCYSIDVSTLAKTCTISSLNAIIENLLPSCLPSNLSSFNTQSVERTDSIYYYDVTATCCLHSPSTLIDWPTAYSKDNDTSIIISTLKLNKLSSIPSVTIQNIHMSYLTHLTKGNIVLLRDKLLLFKAKATNSKILSLMIIPTTIRRTLFDHYHVGPSGAHMG